MKHILLAMFLMIVIIAAILHFSFDNLAITDLLLYILGWVAGSMVLGWIVGTFLFIRDKK